MAGSGVRRLAMSKMAAKGHGKKSGAAYGGTAQTVPRVSNGSYKSPSTTATGEMPVGRKDKTTGYVAGKKRSKTRGTGAATRGTGHTSYT